MDPPESSGMGVFGFSQLVHRFKRGQLEKREAPAGEVLRRGAVHAVGSFCSQVDKCIFAPRRDTY